jgi:hypothetical protein
MCDQGRRRVYQRLLTDVEKPFRHPGADFFGFSCQAATIFSKDDAGP